MLLAIMNQHIPIMQYLEFFSRIVVACVCGAAIGVERSHRLKEAGVRTHLLVCCAAALMIIISKYGFADLADTEGVPFFGDRGADPARIAAQVVSGISFLCAGVIFKQGSVIKGLTTAAGLWATAGIGLALGAGMLPLGVFATILVLLIQIIMHRFPILNDHYQNNHIEITVSDDEGFRSALSKQLNEWHAQVLESSITHNQDGTTSYSMTVKMHNSVKQEDIFTFLEQNSNVSSFRQTING
ncbi:MAG: MgtC/SapB family protein [Clostridia bacterium]|nr:MgtC/SapB family protein [Clostridia bacterium]